MPVRVPDEKRAREAQDALVWRDNAGTQRAADAPAESPVHGLRVGGDERGLPVRVVIGAGIRRHRPPVSRGEVFEELDPRPRGGAQRGDAPLFGDNPMDGRTSPDPLTRPAAD